jgi:hypothetical protein
MAHSYTPGLTVSDRTVVRKRRLLPIPGQVFVTTGEAVIAESVVARAELPGKVQALNVANLLGIAPDEVPDYLVKKAGESVLKDEVIAENRPFIKWLKTEVLSPIQGTLESVSTVTGQVLLREPPRLLDLLGYVAGRVVEVYPQQGVMVEAECAFVQGIFGVGGETWGELTMAVQAPDEVLTPSKLTAAMKGKVVVGGSFLGAETMARAKELGIAALVVGGIHDKDLRALLGYDLGVAITGTERVGFTLVLTEGFGTIPMASKTFTLLKAHVGHKTSVSGATQIRAGVIRPEIIIPLSQLQAQPQAGVAQSGVKGGGQNERGGVKIGDVVRVIRDPLFGRIGTVMALPTELRTIETESVVRVLDVGFSDGSRATIPRSNVELIEE